MAETLRIEIPIETIDKTDPALSNVTSKLKSMGTAATGAGNNMDKARGQVTKFDEQADRTQKSLASWAKEKYEVLLQAKEQVSPVLDTIGSGLRGFAGKTWSVTMKAIDLVTSPVRGIINLLKNPILQAGAVLGVSIGMADTINTYKDFEAAMSQVQAVSGATGSQLEQLTAKAKEMGATTKFTAEESAEAFNYMAMAGWKTEDMLSGTEGILSLAAASGEDLATTSDIVTDALTAFNMSASDAGHFSDVLAAAASNANTTVSGMGETFKYAGSMAGSLGYSIEDVALMTGLMANTGVKATMAGTALNSIFTRLSTNTGGAADALSELGIEFFNGEGNARDLSDVMDELRLATAGMNAEQKSNLANTIAGTQAQKGLLAILNASAEDYGKLADAINNADGAAADMADTMLDNLSGSITLLQSAVDGVKISFGERLAPYVREFADYLTSAMPAIEQGLDEFMDFADRKYDKLKAKIDGMVGSDEWQDADIFGKIKIAWDEIIANPFREWWNSEGKAMLSETAGNIGMSIGSGISAGILMLLGIDVSDTVSEGASVGKAFASGFAEGFDIDLISGRLTEGIGNLFSSAGKLLPGGEPAGLGSIVSAVLLSKLATPVIGLGKGAASAGKGLFGSSAALGGASLMGTLMGSSATGSGLLGLGATAAIDLGAGNLAGGASLGTGALSALGLGATAGGIAAGASLISGALDLYKSAKSADKDYRDAYGESGGSKVAGVAAGAAAGAALGSVIPGIGTAVGALIGAGAGGIAGWIHGSKVKKEYEENLEAAQEAAEKANKVFEATGFSIEDVKFETEALNMAVEDAEVSAEQLGQMFQEAVSDNLISHFGELRLSLTEIKEAAEMIVFNGLSGEFEEFSDAAGKAEASLSALKTDMNSLNKANWRIGLGTNLSEGDAEEYRTAIESLVDDTASYLENKHYEATLALKLIFGNDGDTANLDSAYATLEGQLDGLSSRLSEELDANVITLPDGTLQLNQTEEMTSLQQQIADITTTLADAEEEANFAAINIKYGGAAMDYESFAGMQEELASMAEDMQSQYDEALKVNLTNLQIQLDAGAIDEAGYDEQLQALADSYDAKISGMQVRVESFQLESIAEAYSSELADIMPEIEGTTAEKLKEAMGTALAANPDAGTWTSSDVAGWFGLESLGAETQTALAELLKGVAQSMPQQLIDSLKEQADFAEAMEQYGPISNEHYQQMLESEELADTFSGAGAAYSQDILAGFETGILGASGLMRTAAEAQLADAFADPFSVTANVNVKTDYIPMPVSSYAAASQAGGAKGHAGGGIVGGRELTWVGEEGPEAIIPLVPGRRGRALELFEQAGEMLGVGRHADGGFTGGAQFGLNPHRNAEPLNYITEAVSNAPSGYSEPTGGSYDYRAPTQSTYQPGGADGGGNEIHVEVRMSPEFSISGAVTQGEDDIVAVIRRHMKEMADELGGEIASKLEAVFSNMPLKEA